MEWYVIAALIILTILYIFGVYRMFCVIYNKEKPIKLFMPFASFALVNVIILTFGTFGHIAMGLAFCVAIVFWTIAVAVGAWVAIINGEN